jgi:diguanylate cyclase (GGDEF)-like protein
MKGWEGLTRICMTDFVGPQANTPAQSQPITARRKAARFSGLAAAQVCATVGLVLLIGSHHPAGWNAAIQLVLAGGLLVSMLWPRARRNAVEREVSRLHALLVEIRHGREPIEMLSRCDTSVAPLAAACQDLIHDLRQERARAAGLQDEIRQRVASRTESLERTIGALRQQAAKDGLTGLFNRRMLDAYLPDAIDRCKTSGTSLCLLMIDIDHFKPLNDTLGHAAGDQMLKSVAQIIRSTIRETDLAFRNGGDEFVVVLEGCSPETGRVLADRLNSLGDALGRTFRLSPPPTLSVGMTSLAEVQDATAPIMLRQADAALYQIKAAHHAAVSALPPRSRRTG